MLRGKPSDRSGKKKGSGNGLTELEETILFMTRPYLIFVLVCWALSLFCMLHLRNDMHSASLGLSVFTFALDSVFLFILYRKAKHVRNKK
ncbi:MAG TPA: hypothetical protein DDW86_03715 [Clostridiales bacterium]|jgi:urea transporter|nr:hypothetical protein [Clostridiales bacterium]